MRGLKSSKPLISLAEGQGFEPWVPLDTLVFKTSAFNRSATPPVEGESYALWSGCQCGFLGFFVVDLLPLY